MGVSISIAGALPSAERRKALLDSIATRAADLEWSVRRVERSFRNATLRRGRTSTTLEMARLSGVSLLPHFACEEVPLIFVEGDGVLVEEVVVTAVSEAPKLLAGVLVKTQFAGPAVHREVCDVLNEMKSRFFPDVAIDDESGFATTGDAAALEAAFREGWAEIARKIRADRHGPGAGYQVGEFPFEVPKERPAGEFGGVNEKQREFLLACERAGFVHLGGLGTSLDRSRESIADLELSISDVDADPALRDAARSEVQELAVMAGACFGRAIASILGGSWRVDDGQFLLTDVGRSGLVIDPFEVARDRIANGPPYSFVNHLGVYDAIAAHLARPAAS